MTFRRDFLGLFEDEITAKRKRKKRTAIKCQIRRK